MSKTFSHLTEEGEVRMVDISGKPVERRIAVAEGTILLQEETLQRISANTIAKGNVLATARIAGIQAVKRTDELIPLCHSLPIQHVEVQFAEPTVKGNFPEVNPFASDLPSGSNFHGLRITCSVTTVSRTGVEMEALTGVTIAALTIYDMCKAVDHAMAIHHIHLVSKTKEPI